MDRTDQPETGTVARPKSLKLEFSKAADYGRINELFDPAVKKKIDPHGYVIRRVESHFRRAVDEGAAGMLKDENGHVRSLTIAYRVHGSDAPAPGEPHDFTEIGTSMTGLPGYNASRIVIAALAIREYLSHPPKHRLVADIKKENGASIKTYRDTLGWRTLEDPALRTHATAVTDRTVADEKNKAAHNIAGENAVSEWFTCDAATMATQAKVLLAFMDAGGLTGKKTGDFIPVDFSALAAEGITRKTLESLASGAAPHPLRLTA